MTTRGCARRTHSRIAYSVAWGPGCSCGAPGSSSISTDRVTPRYTSAADDAWGLDVWTERLPDDEVQASLVVYDDFYAAFAERLDRLAANGPFVVLDVHSYNHRRQGPDKPAAAESDNPEVNVGTGALDQQRWGAVVGRFIDDLRAERVAGHHLDVRENVRFRGGHLSRWVAGRYPDTGCVLAIEFKKVFMDEWTGEPNVAHITELAGALEAAVQPTLDVLTGKLR